MVDDDCNIGIFDFIILQLHYLNFPLADGVGDWPDCIDSGHIIGDDPGAGLDGLIIDSFCSEIGVEDEMRDEVVAENDVRCRSFDGVGGFGLLVLLQGL